MKSGLAQDSERTVPLTALSLGFVLLSLLLSYLVPIGVVFAKMQSDAAAYLTQAKHLWFHGVAWGFSIGDGLGRIVYSPVPAYLRAIFFGLTSDAGALVRLIQWQNILILLSLAIVSSHYLQLRLPPDWRKWSYIPFIYLLTTYNPWLLNLILPLGDHVYALLFISTVTLLSRVSAGNQAIPARRRVLALLLAATATIQKFAGIALIAMAAQNLPRDKYRTLWITAIGAAALLIIVFYRDLFLAYADTGIGYYYTGRPLLQILLDSAVNLIVAAIPNQVIPNFSYVFSRNFSATHAVTASSLTLTHAPWILLGVAISLVVIRGVSCHRRQLASEITILVIVLPIYSFATNSTSRYLASAQPVIFLMFILGLQSIRETVQVKKKRLMVCVYALVSVIVINVPINISRSFTSIDSAQVTDLPKFLAVLDKSFRAAQEQILDISRRYPQSKFVLLSDELRWYPLADATYIAPPRALQYLCSGVPVFTIFACDARNCSRLQRAYDLRITEEMHPNISFLPIKHEKNYAAAVSIDRLRLDSARSCLDVPPLEQSK